MALKPRLRAGLFNEALCCSLHSFSLDNVSSSMSKVSVIWVFNIANLIAHAIELAIIAMSKVSFSNLGLQYR